MNECTYAHTNAPCMHDMFMFVIYTSCHRCTYVNYMRYTQGKPTLFRHVSSSQSVQCLVNKLRLTLSILVNWKVSKRGCVSSNVGVYHQTWVCIIKRGCVSCVHFISMNKKDISILNLYMIQGSIRLNYFYPITNIVFDKTNYSHYE